MKNIFFTVGILLFLILPLEVLADGGLFPPPFYWAQETAQKAVIVYEDNIETLIISMSFEGDAQDFSWVIPTPSRPEVDKASHNLFVSLEDFFEDKYERYKEGLPPLGDFQDGVDIIEKKKVDIYDITVLSASDLGALFDWLNSNDYRYPSAGKYILDEYIANSWFFTAIKVNTESLDIAAGQLREGTANPIKLVFPSEKIVYPLKISSLVVGEDDTVADYGMPITLYVFADSGKEAIGFDSDWSGWVDADWVDNLAFDDQGNPWYDAKERLVLTRLNAWMRLSEMNNDVFLTDKAGSAPVPVAYDYELVSQNAYPTISNNGDGATLSLTLLNTGYEPWFYEGDNPVYLGASNKEDRLSAFYTHNNNDWLSPNRIRATNIYPPTYPGEQMEFNFIVSTTSLKNGVYREYFTPVVENKTWMKDIGIYWDITVAPATYSAQYETQSSFPTVKKGETADLWVVYKNTGTATWELEGSAGYTVRLGTSNSLDRESMFYSADSWRSSNRVGTFHLDGIDGNADVPPGSWGRLNFQIQAPDTPGVYREYFRPVIDGFKWLEDVGLYWDIEVY